MKRNGLLITMVLLLSTCVYGQKNVVYNNSFWDATISGNTHLMLQLKLNKTSFIFSSPKGSSKNIVGSNYLMGKLLGKITNRAIEIKGTYFWKNDTLYLKGKYHSLTSTQDFSASIHRNQLNGSMSSNQMKGIRLDNCKPLKDYKAIAKSAIDTTEKYLFNPAILKSHAWVRFKKRILKNSQKVYDDYEFEKMYNSAGRQLPFTHYGVSINAVQEKQNSTKTTVKSIDQPKFIIRRINDSTMLFTVKTFSASASDIRPFIDSLKTMTFNNLIIDLRNNGGGTIASALPLARFLVQDTLYGGMFLTKMYFLQHTETPRTEFYKNYPLFSEASFPLIINGIHTQEGLCLVVNPDDKTFKGRLYLLTNKNTASTCEPLVYGLQSTKRAIVVGETTCGAMLNGERFTLTTDYSLWMPTADYYTADGFKIDKKGVKPNVKVKSEDALLTTLDLIIVGS